MKKYTWAWAVACLLLLSTSCADDILVNEVVLPAEDGSEIIFGARAGFENANPNSRTEYSGVDYKYYNTWYERVDWVFDTDQVQIYCPQGAGTQFSDYIVRNANVVEDEKSDADSETDHLNSYSYLEKIDEAAPSIQWNGDGDHTFYAMYPSSEMFRDDLGNITVKQGLAMVKDEANAEKVIVNGVIPVSQNGTIVPDGAGNYTIKPNMKYAYMVAKNTATRSDASVELSFVPIVTALQIEMIVPENPNQDVFGVEMTDIRLTGKGIAGNFTVNLSDWNPTGGTYPSCDNVEEGSADYINISTWMNDLPLTLEEGQKITFTVFMRPGADYSDLKVVYSGPQGTKSKPMQVTIKKCKKTRINKLYLPAFFKEEDIVVDNSKWMSQLPKTAKLKKLSIPGTGGSFSFKSSDETGHYRSQHTHMDLAAQWKHGIRAFEIVTNRKNSTASSTSINDEPIKCNGEELGDYDVQTVVKELLEILDASYNAETDMYETAMLILTYQPEGSSPARNSGAYMTQVVNYVSTLPGDRLIQYSPNLTLGEAQKRLMIVVRPTQQDEDDNDDWNAVTNALNGKTNADKILVIDGCGTAKDRWGARGYNLISQTYTRTRSGLFNPTYSYSYSLNLPHRAADISNAVYETESYPESGLTQSYQYYDCVEAFMKTNASYGLSTSNSFSMTPGKGNDGDKVSITRGDMDFSFVTNGGFNCWYQEWQRVVEKDVYKAAGDWIDVNANNAKRSYPAVYWFESYNEKLSNAKGTLDMAISGEHNDKVFINSLCGYLANDDADNNVNCLIPSLGNAYGGNGGNIYALAKLMNEEFYRYVVGRGLDQTTGPTGVVLMDYVNNKKTENLQYDGSYLLPTVIINNNFKHTLDVEDDDKNLPPGEPDGGEG